MNPSAALARGYTTYSQQSTVFAEETVWKSFLSALFKTFLEGHKHKAECKVCHVLKSCLAAFGVALKLL